MYLYSLGLSEDVPQFDLLFQSRPLSPQNPPCVACPLPQCSTSPLWRTSTQIPRPSTACARRTFHRRPRWPRRNIRSNSSTRRLPQVQANTEHTQSPWSAPAKADTSTTRKTSLTDTFKKNPASGKSAVNNPAHTDLTTTQKTQTDTKTLKNPAKQTDRRSTGNAGTL